MGYDRPPAMAADTERAPEADGADAPAPPRPPSVAREAALLLGARIATAAMTGVLGVVLAHSLGPRRYGVLALAGTVVGILGLLSDLGIGESTARFAAEAYPDRRRIAAVAAVGLRLRAVLGLLLGGAVLVAAAPLAAVLGTPTLAPVLRAAALLVVASDIFDVVQSTLQATRRSPLVISLTLLRGSVELALVIALLVGIGRRPEVAMIGSGIAWSLAALVGSLAVLRDRGDAAAGPGWRGLLGYGRRIWLATIAFIGFTSIDQLLLNARLGVKAVGLYDPPFRLVATTQLLANAVVSAVCPRLTADRETASRIFDRALRALLALYAVGSLVVFALSHEIVAGMLGPDYARSADVLRWFLPYMVMIGISSFVSVSLNYLGAAAGRGRIAIAALAVNAVADLALIPTVGLIGPAIGTGIAFALYVAGHVVLCRRELDFSLRRAGRSLAVALAVGALAALAAALTARLAPLPPLADAALGGLVGLAVGAAGLVVTRELDRSLLDVLRHR